ncbi:MAG: 23S rRNA (pseudouridine(1915)-N(3))-methyltransferase RlmH [Clostridia bacterium]|nr:23S rRNA (pseudouridine(1915)-N(3))-methyltransferase RlmH [Clostridia bacterium]
MRITIIAVGKLKEKYFLAAGEEYEKRLSRFCKLNIIEIEPEKLPDKPSDAQIEAAKNAEGKKILQKIPSDASVCALCIEGKMVDSPTLAERIDREATGGAGHRIYIIGGSYGLSDEVKARSDERMSMSPMTFPHKLARIMLLEQIYRAFMILGGGTYHK